MVEEDDVEKATEETEGYQATKEYEGRWKEGQVKIKRNNSSQETFLEQTLPSHSRLRNAFQIHSKWLEPSRYTHSNRPMAPHEEQIKFLGEETMW